MDGKWKVEPHDNYMCDEGVRPVQIVDGDGKVVACNTDYYPTAITPENAETIVSAVNEVAELRVQLATARAALQEIAGEDEIHTKLNELRLCCKFQDIAVRALGAA